MSMPHQVLEIGNVQQWISRGQLNPSRSSGSNIKRLTIQIIAIVPGTDRNRSSGYHRLIRKHVCCSIEVQGLSMVDSL